MTTISRATWVDDDGSGTTGTIINNARLQGDIYDKVDQGFATLDGKDASQDTAIAGKVGPHNLLSATHPDTVPGTLVAGDLLIVDGTGKLARLPKSVDGSVLSLVSGFPGWNQAGQWQSYAYAAGNLQAATGTWNVPGAPGAPWVFQYCVVGKVALVSIAIGPATTSAATAWVQVLLPAAIQPAAANQNLLGSYYNGTALTQTTVNLSPGGGVRWNASVAGTGTIPASAAIYLNAMLFYPLP